MQKLITEEEFETWSQTFEGRAEFVDGEVIILSPESYNADNLRVFLQMLMRLFVEHHDLGILGGPNVETRLRPGLRRVPDTYFLSNTRMQNLNPTFIARGPDLALEVVSPDSVERDRGRKLQDYQEAGVDEYWIIDPLCQEVLLYVRTQHGLTLAVAEGTIYRSTVLPGFFLDAAWLWRNPLPKVMSLLPELGLL